MTWALWVLAGLLTALVLRALFYRLLGICPRCKVWMLFEVPTWTGANGWCAKCGYSTRRRK